MRRFSASVAAWPLAFNKTSSRTASGLDKFRVDPVEAAVEALKRRSKKQGQTLAPVSHNHPSVQKPEYEEPETFDKFPEAGGHKQYPEYVSADGNPEVLRQWEFDMKNKYGEATWEMMRALYKDLVDEMRREFNLKPPAPFYPPSSSASVATSAGKDSNMVPSPWTVTHKPGSDGVAFTRVPNEMDKAEGRNLVTVHMQLEIQENEDPSARKVLFDGTYPMLVQIFKNGIVMEFETRYHDQQIGIQTCRTYVDPSFEAHAGIPLTGEEFKEKMATTKDGRNKSVDSVTKYRLGQNNSDVKFERENLIYDGPHIHHLEQDHIMELVAVVYDEGVNSETVAYFAGWVHYLEHAEYVRWNILYQKAIQRRMEPIEEENELVTREERQELDLATEAWSDQAFLS